MPGSLGARLRARPVLATRTLGTVLERLAEVHGKRRLVEEADGAARPDLRAGRRPGRPPGRAASPRRSSVATVVVVATPNSYEQLLLCLGRQPGRGHRRPRSTPDARRRDRARDRRRRRLARRCARSPTSRGRRRCVVPSRPTQATSPRSSTRRAPPASRRASSSPIGGCSAGPRQRRCCLALQLRRDEAVVSLPVAHIMGFAMLVGLAGAGIPTYFLPQFRPDEVLDAIEDRRATVFVGVPAMYRMLLEAGAEQRDLSSVRACGLGCRRHARRAGRPLPQAGRHGPPAALRPRGRGHVRRGLRAGRVGRRRWP